MIRSETIVNDPKVALTQYYQSLSPPITISFKTCFSDYNDAPHSISNIVNQYWRSEFHCPLSHTVYYSGLDSLQIIASSQEEKEPGNFLISDEYVYFKNKKDSRSSAAKAALESLKGQQKTVFRSYKELWLHQHPDQQQQDMTTESFLTVTTNEDDNSSIEESVDVDHNEKSNSSTRKMSIGVTWVERLHQLGVKSPSNFSMFFTQVHPVLTSTTMISSTEGKDIQCNGCSTLIRCCIDIFVPRRLTAWGDPSSSKNSAISSAVTLLEEILSKNIKSSNQKQVLNFHPLPPEIISQFRKHVPTICQYSYSLLPCFTQPPLITAATNSASTMFLYELKFTFATHNNTDVSSKSLASHLCGFEKDIMAITPLGILVPIDIMPCRSASCRKKRSSHKGGMATSANSVEENGSQKSISAIFSLGSCSDKTNNNLKYVTVHLTRRTAVDSITQHQFELLKCFHDKMDLWRHYGLFHQQNYQPSKERSNLDKPFSPMDRTYLLAPLQITTTAACDNADKDVHIDWGLLNQLFNGEVTPFLQKRSPFGFLLLALLLLLPSIGTCCYLMKDGVSPTICSVIFFGLLFVFAIYMMIIRKKIPNQATQYLNKYLTQQVNEKLQLYVPYVSVNDDNKTNTKYPTDFIFGTPSSATQSQQLTVKERETHLRKYQGLDLASATYVDYYFKKYAIKIKQKSIPLIPAYPCHNTSKFTTDHDAPVIHIVPELVNILPMPRDLLCLSQYRSSFLTSLEIVIHISHVESWLRRCAQKVDLYMPAISRVSHNECPLSSSPSTTCNDQQHTVRDSLADFLSDALCHHSHCVENNYQRLEFVGDTVLGFYTAINLFSRNASLHWNIDDLEQISAHAVKNSSIFNAALRTGVPNFIITRDATKWQSAYSQVRESFNFHPVFEISDKTISDTVEALLGAIHLGSENKEEACCMCIGFLNELDLPLRQGLVIDDDSELQRKSHLPWFSARGACIQEDGYPFKKDRKWLDAIANIGTIIFLAEDVASVLKTGREALFRILAAHNFSERDVHPNAKKQEILVYCALFDDSLSDDDDQSSVTYSSLGDTGNSIARSEDSDVSNRRGQEAVGLVRVALVRDTLSMVGNAALMLCLAEECFERYPNATAGDLHLLKTCTLSNDVLAYLMIKTGISECLYDKRAVATTSFFRHMKESDCLGEEVWRGHGGWIVPGGLEEYHRRCEAVGKSEQKAPKYVGLACGKLVGFQKKLPSALTSDLVFSMKAICGALVLSFGQKRAWKNFLLPLFEELLLLEPAELLRMEKCRICIGNEQTEQNRSND